ncbi:MAG: metallopeptidase family protein [Chloroflexota bacterium]
MPASDDPEEEARDAFDALVGRAVEAIPEPYASALRSVAIVVEDAPLPGQVPPGQMLFGLYQGVPRTTWAADWVPVPAKITIYRRPHEIRYPDPVARQQGVEDTVRHEIAHHLGVDEAGIRSIEAERRAHRG